MNDLWDPPYYEATEDTNHGNDGCLCAFCLDYDEMEQATKNESSCIQVLSILIGKADSDIIELEEELMHLLSQLAYTDEVFSNMLCVSLRVKIDFLDLSIRKLKDDAADFLSTSKEPAESILDMLNSLFSRYLQNKDQQFADNTTNVAKRRESCTNAATKQMENSKSSIDKHTISLTRVKTEDSNDFSASSFNDVDNTKDGEVNKFQTKDMTPRCKSVWLKITQGNWKHQLKVIKSQTDDERIGSTSIRSVESSSEEHTNRMRNVTSEMAIYVDKSKSKLNPISGGLVIQNTQRKNMEPNRNFVIKQENNHEGERNYNPQESALAVSLFCTKKYKRQEKQSSSSPGLLEGAKSIGMDGCDNYTVDDLRAIAKQQKVKGYYKLRKSELAKALGIKLIEGKKKHKIKKGDANTA